MKTQLILLAMLFLISAPQTAANRESYSFNQITIEQGLSQSTVSSLLKDEKGMLWIGTKSGLNRFDKNECRSYFHEAGNEFSLPGNRVYMVYEDLLKNIWVATSNGLALYQKEHDRFETILKGVVFSAVEIPGGILFGGMKWLYKYNYNDGKVISIDLGSVMEKGDATDYKVISMQAYGDRIVFATNQKGAYTIGLEGYQIEKLPFGDVPFVITMHMASNGSFYFSSFRNGVYCYDSEGRLMRHYNTATSELNNDIIMSFIERNGQLWLATDGGGINILDMEKESISIIQHIPGDGNSLPVNSITLLYQDRDENLWAGTVRGGIFGIRETFIKSYKDVTLNSPNGLSEKAIISLFEDKNGMLWIGTDGGGINVYNPKTGQFRHFLSTYRDKVVSITEFSETEMLVSLFGKGNFLFNKNTGRYKPFTIVNDSINREESFADFMPLIHKVAKDKIYILSKNAYVYQPSTNRFTSLKPVGLENIPSALILMYADDNICFAVNENRIFEISPMDDSIRLLFELEPGEVINSIAYCPQGQMWIGSDKGLSLYDITSKQWRRIDTRLFSDISYLLLDKQNRLWICAQNMLFSYIHAEERFVVWGETDGFSANEILFMYQNCSNEENIYLGGTNGLVVIDTHISSDDDFRPQINIQDIELNGGSFLDQQLNGKIEIPYNYTSLLVKFDVNEKDIFRKTLFRYSITGQNNYTLESYDRTLNLPSLSPGDYSIEVVCNTKSGDWSEPLHLSIEVTPPWYQTFPFMAGMLVLALLVAMSIIYYIIRKNKAKLRLQMIEHEQEVNNSKIQFLVNVSHELRTPLTLIYAPLKRLLQKEEKLHNDPMLKNELSGIYKQAGLMKNIINMVLDINKMEEGLNKLNCALHTLNPWVMSIAEDFRKEYEKKNIRLVYRLDESIDQVWFDESKCRIVLSNFLSNALKFSLPETVTTVSSGKTGDFVRISVTDQGTGFGRVDPSRLFSRFYQEKQEVNSSGIGLAYAKQLAELHGGSVGAFNNEDKGATFYFDLPVVQGEVTDKVAQLPERFAGDESIRQSGTESLPDYSCKEYSLLIMEDNDDFREYLKKEISDYFKRVYTAKDGKEGLVVLKEKKPDIVVSDVMMPRMDGYEVCRRIKEDIEVSHIPVILLTARGDEESVSLGYKLGADFYLSKPFDIEMLLTLIRNLLLNRERIRTMYKDHFSFVTPVESTISYVDEQFMLKLNNFINNNLENPELDIDFLTVKMGMGRTSLYNKIKKLTGISLNDYIYKVRIERAAYLLVNTNLDVTQIAYDVGFTYQRYFSTLFKKRKGMTPSQYREENR